MISNLSNAFEIKDYAKALNISTQIACTYLREKDTINYFNYRNKSILYLFEIEPNLAIMKQKALLDEALLSTSIPATLISHMLNQFVVFTTSQNSTLKDSDYLKKKLLCADSSDLSSGLRDNYHNLCYAYGKWLQHKEDYQQSLSYYIKALDTGVNSGNPLLRRISNVLYVMGEYGLALDASILSYDQSKTTFEKAILLNTMGNALFKLENYSKAVLFYKLSEVERQKLENNHNGLAVVHQNLGNSYQEICIDSAAKYYYKAIYECKSNQVTDQVLHGNALNNLGNYYQNISQLDSSLLYYNKALTIRKIEREVQNSATVHQSYYNIARTYLEIGEYDICLEYCDSATTALNELISLEIKTQGAYSTNNYNIDSYYTQWIKAKALKHLFEKNQNVNVIQQSLTCYYSAIRSITKNQTGIFEERSKVIRADQKKKLILETLAVQFQVDSICKNRSPNNAFRLFSEAHNSQFTDILLKKEKKIRLLKSKFFRSLTNIPDIQLSYQDNRNINNIFTELTKVSKGKEIRDLIFSCQNLTIPTTTRINEPSFESLKILNKDERLVMLLEDPSEDIFYYFTYENGIYQYGSAPSYLRLQSEIKELDQALKNYNFREVDRTLYKVGLRFKNILGLEREKESNPHKIFIIPDQSLWNIPYDALIIDKTGVKKYAIELTNIILQLSPIFLVNERLKAKCKGSENHEKKWVSFAPIDFEGISDRLPDLPFTLIEVVAITKNLKKFNLLTPQCHTYRLANTDNLKRVNSEHYLHIASHSKAGDRSSLQGFCLFENKKIRSIDYDYILNNNISPSYIFLNICSGFRPLHISGEGPINLNRAFLLNGAKNIVFTNRIVPDIFAAEFAVKYYQRLAADFNVTKALRKTKIEFIASKKYANPSFWCNYQLISSF